MTRTTPVITAMVAALVLPGAAFACDAQAEITAFYGQDQATIYRYPATDPTGNGIIGVLGDLFGRIDVGAAYVAIDDTDDSAAIYLYAPSGCGVRAIPFNRDDLLSLFDALGTSAPFGEGFHQIPGLPGSVPGFATGPSL